MCYCPLICLNFKMVSIFAGTVSDFHFCQVFILTPDYALNFTNHQFGSLFGVQRVPICTCFRTSKICNLYGFRKYVFDTFPYEIVVYEVNQRRKYWTSIAAVMQRGRAPMQKQNPRPVCHFPRNKKIGGQPPPGSRLNGQPLHHWFRDPFTFFLVTGSLILEEKNLFGKWILNLIGQFGSFHKL